MWAANHLSLVYRPHKVSSFFWLMSFHRANFHIWFNGFPSETITLTLTRFRWDSKLLPSKLFGCPDETASLHTSNLAGIDINTHHFVASVWLNTLISREGMKWLLMSGLTSLGIWSQFSSLEGRILVILNGICQMEWISKDRVVYDVNMVQQVQRGKTI